MSQVRSNAGMRGGPGQMPQPMHMPKQQTPGLLLLNPASQQHAMAAQMDRSGQVPHPQVHQVPQMMMRGAMIQGGVPQQQHHIQHYQGSVQQAVPVSAQQPPATQQLPTQENESSESFSSANIKEKTPMCLINELARHNKTSHQYTLTDEQGPAHKKTFYVKLKLGDEEYSEEGPSIKKAQHAAAKLALEKTAFKHPPPKPTKNYGQAGCEGNNLTPTVELNSIAMKRGEAAIYKPIEPHRPMQFNQPPNMDFRGMYNQRYHYPRMPRVCYVSLKVGQREFIGEGGTRQMARHNAAAKALNILRKLPLPNNATSFAKVPEQNVITGGAKPVAPTSDGAKSDSKAESSEDLKSEISLVHEIALKANLPVNFEVVRESGPPHMRCFVTQCTVGEYSTEAEGNGKKISKKRAAEKMLEELKKLPGLPAQNNAKVKVKAQGKKKNRNLIKMQKTVADYGVGINPISRLIQIQQAKKEKEPIYTLVQERGLPRRREFVIQVTVGSQQCTGVGPNKRLAKRAAAEAMLQQLGYSQRMPEAGKPAIKLGAHENAGDKKVKFVDQEPVATTSSDGLGRQVVPGILLMPDPNRPGVQGIQNYPVNQQPGLQRSPGPHIGMGYSPQTTAAIAKELLDQGSSPTAEALVKSTTKPVSPQQSNVIRPKQQLLYLADVLNFQVQFTDFPKGSNKSEYLSLVSLSTNPPQVSHGAGTTIEASHDAAALTALKALSEIGLGAVTRDSGEKLAASGPSGDGPHLNELNGKAPVAGSDSNSTSVPIKQEK
ncbi:unnamed protein product [Owenia fusiformis]|uniref:Uncharacterized protein n=1 Tax=Owenia fusiformis TaxID=6347 RepID=A0A8J1Y225_OWEFU|nr:unnamed protein product [Owenia fusiformis]